MSPAPTEQARSSGEQLVPGPGPGTGPTATAPLGADRQAPAAAVAVHLAGQRPAKGETRVHLASSDRRAEEIGRALADLAPDLEILVLPPWDCLPYDRASPGREIMGRRMAVLRRLTAKTSDRFLLLSPESLLQRAPPAEAVSATFKLSFGQLLDREALFAFAQATGYVADDRVDEPGEIALLGEVVDVYPADAALPVRIVVDADGRVSDLRTYDPLTQRTDGTIEALTLGPASELVLGADDDVREPGVEHRMSAHYASMPSLFEIIPKAKVTRDGAFDDRLAESLAQIADAFEAHRMLRAAGDAAAPEPAGLYLSAEEAAAGLGGWRPKLLALTQVSAVPSVAGARNPGRAFCDLVEAERTAERRVVLAGLAHERRALARALGRGLHVTPIEVSAWFDVEAAAPGSIVSLDLDIDAGFVDSDERLTVIAASDVLGGRLASRGTGGDRSLLAAEPDLRLGDVVLHEDHGVGVLRELQTIEIDGVTHDTLRLGYHGGASLLAPVAEIGRIWRYGAEEEAVSLDRLKGDAWPKRRAEVSRHMDEAAARLVELAKVRAAAACAPIPPPGTAYARFAARFGYPETPDQATAIAAVLADLGSGRPMDRLICGDVGFGKTEVALRAAAAVALSGRQVAVCAPTTVLAKQHFQTFQRRFAGTGIKVEQLSRLVAARDAKAVREAIAEGEAGIVVGTHALAGDHVAFADLGLMIIDEEQKFGAAVKQRLRDLAGGGHLLSMTATPIPRTLQAAMIGVQDVSVIASPPARRRPIRTFLAPFDAASVRTALLREKRRGGQSFLVAPRIEDIAPLAAQLQALAPELSVTVAHGGLPADEVDSVMVGFAEGEGDVLLATNIIESGLDVPRANTMIIWRPDRFGLSQLHQLRGRVGRGRAQGIAYLLHDPAEELSDATRARLSTLEAFDRLGSGLAISARDLDLRGAGDLTGEDQAGHMQMIGAALYHRLLDRAVRLAKGEVVEDASPPTIKLGERGAIPVDHVPDAVTRINLYGRLARLDSIDAIEAFADELQDRFGALPPALEDLLAQSRLAALARAAHVREVSAGPKGVALTLNGPSEACLRKITGLAAGSELKGDRLIVPVASETGPERLAVVEKLLTTLAV
jgi:transcription-repair coupling factor (superfamily II helicase)